MRLQLSTWPEVEAYLQRSKGIILPLGSTEQHGPNGPIGTDAICPETIANGVAERTEVMVGPTFNLGMAQHHLAFPGTITLRPTTFLVVVRDAVVSLARHGFERIYFLNGHGGNVATANAAFSEVYAERSLAGTVEGAPTLHLKLFSWFEGKRVRELTETLFSANDGGHAAPSEISLSWFAFPEAVKSVKMTPEVAPRGIIRDAEDYRRQFPDGRIGSDPSLASIEAGRRIYDVAVEDILEDYLAFLDDG